MTADPTDVKPRLVFRETGLFVPFTLPVAWARADFLSENSRNGHFVKAAATRQVKTAVKLMAHGKPRMKRAVARITFVSSDMRRRDADNLAVLGKACLDACVSAGLLPDDSFHFVPATVQHIVKGDEKALIFELIEVDG